LLAIKGDPRQARQVFYFLTKRFVSVTVLVGAALEIANISPVFQPDGRVAAPYPFEPRTAWLFPIGKIYSMRADAENARTEGAENGRLAEVVGDPLLHLNATSSSPGLTSVFSSPARTASAKLA
jgi:hypothetical protein